MTTVLITGVGGPAGGAVAELLKARGHRVIGVDMREVSSDSCDVVTTVPGVDDPSYVTGLVRLVKQYDVELVIPTVSEELLLMSLAKETFPASCEVAISGADSVGVCDDKLFTASALARQDIPVPRFAVPGDFSGPAEAAQALGDPFISKPRRSRGGRGVQLLSADSTAQWDALDDSVILQEFAPGDEYGPMAYRTDDFADVVVLKKTGLRDGVVGNATGTARVASEDAPKVRDLAAQVMAALGLVGPADMDIRINAEGEPVLLEVNARFGANTRSAAETVDYVLRDKLRATES